MLGWLAAGAAAGEAPAPLVPLAGPQPPVAAAVNEPPPLSPAVTKPLAVPGGNPGPLLPPARPAAEQPRTLYYHKEPAPPAPPPGRPAVSVRARPANPPERSGQDVRQVAGRQPLEQPPLGDIQQRLPPSVEATLKRKGVPSPEAVFSLRTEDQINREIQREGGEGIFSIIPRNLPVETRYDRPLGGYESLSAEPFAGRTFPPAIRKAEPGYVVHHRLYFEELNSERYGWEAGPLQPIISTGYFFRDLTMLPYNFATRPCQRYDTSYGKCLPGDPVPYILYPTELSLAGALTEAGVIVGLFALFP